MEAKNGFVKCDLGQNSRQLLNQRLKLGEQALESTHKTLGLITESETIGAKAAEELIRQKEQLSGVEDYFDSINANLDYTEKELKRKRSVFESVKTYFTKKSDGNGVKRNENYLFDGNDRSDSKASPITSRKDPVSSEQDDEIEAKIDRNLQDIDLGVERLKKLSLNLSEEINCQIPIIDRIASQSEKAEQRVRQHTNRLKKLLAK